MSKPLTKQCTDYSDAASFSFGFFCDICGKEWKSPVVQFETDFSSIANEEARQMLWAQEHKDAFEHANLEAHIHHNLCAACGKWVCDECFVIGKDGSEVCKKCC